MTTLSQILQHTTQVDTCLIWNRCLNTDGYPRMAYQGNSNGKVHRIVYELSTGENIDGKVVRHTCDNPRCINPEHLISGTATDNMRDRDLRFRHGAAKLSPEDVLEIRRRFADNPKLKSPILAQEFHVSSRTILSIKHGTHWKTLLI